MRLSNNAMTTKAKSLFAKKLNEKDYQDLLQKKSISEIVSYLKNDTYFKDALDGVNENIHRGQLEILIRTDLFNRFVKLMKYNFDNRDDFYKFEIIEVEIEQILDVVKSFISNDRETLISKIPYFLSSHMSFDIEKLAASRDFDELLDVLKNTDYYKLILPYKKLRVEDIDYIILEHALKEYYYNKILYLARNNYKNNNLKDIEDIIYTEIELDNFLKIYRMKKYFNMSKEKIRVFITPIYKHFTKNDIETMLNSNPSTILEMLNKSIYGNYIEGLKFETIEQYIKNINYRISSKYMYFSTNSDVIIFSYMMISEIEISNLIDIIEGKRYGLPNEKISSLLVY